MPFCGLIASDVQVFRRHLDPRFRARRRLYADRDAVVDSLIYPVASDGIRTAGCRHVVKSQLILLTVDERLDFPDDVAKSIRVQKFSCHNRHRLREARINIRLTKGAIYNDGFGVLRSVAKSRCNVGLTQ